MELPSPLSEVICGATFEPTESFKPFNYGSVVDHFRTKGYSDCKEHPPTLNQVEKEDMSTTTLSAPGMNTRLWLVNPQTNDLYQLQMDRFLFNWREGEAAKEYPNYPWVLEQFVDGWQDFIDIAFVRKEIAPPKMTQLELSYVNVLHKGVHWLDDGYLNRIFPILPDFKDTKLPEPEYFQFAFAFAKMKDIGGRVHATCYPGFAKNDRKSRVLQVTFTARGLIEPMQDVSHIKNWFEIAHNEIRSVVKGIMPWCISIN